MSIVIREQLPGSKLGEANPTMGLILSLRTSSAVCELEGKESVPAGFYNSQSNKKSISEYKVTYD
jgi:hypothetical protein